MLTDLSRLMFDDGASRTVTGKSTSLPVAEFTYRDKRYRAFHIENPREWSGFSAWFFATGRERFGIGIDPSHDLNKFLRDPGGFAAAYWYGRNPGWPNGNGRFSDLRFREGRYQNPTFLRFEEVR